MFFHAKVPPVTFGHGETISILLPWSFPASLFFSCRIWPPEPRRAAKKAPKTVRLTARAASRNNNSNENAETNTKKKKKKDSPRAFFYLKLRASRPRRHAGNLYLCSRVRTYVCEQCFPLLARLLPSHLLLITSSALPARTSAVH